MGQPDKNEIPAQIIHADKISIPRGSINPLTKGDNDEITQLVNEGDNRYQINPMDSSLPHITAQIQKCRLELKRTRIETIEKMDKDRKADASKM